MHAWTRVVQRPVGRRKETERRGIKNTGVQPLREKARSLSPSLSLSFSRQREKGNRCIGEGENEEKRKDPAKGGIVIFQNFRREFTSGDDSRRWAHGFSVLSIPTPSLNCSAMKTTLRSRLAPYFPRRHARLRSLLVPSQCTSDLATLEIFRSNQVETWISSEAPSALSFIRHARRGKLPRVNDRPVPPPFVDVDGGKKKKGNGTTNTA